MSSVSILTPVVVAARPVFSATVAAAATSMGYSVVANVLDQVGPRTAASKNLYHVKL